MAWHLPCSGWSILGAWLPSELGVNVGNGKVIDGTVTYLATAPVIVGDSLTEWVMLEQ